MIGGGVSVVLTLFAIGYLTLTTPEPVPDDIYTIMQKANLPGPNEIQKEGLTSFVGAVTDGLYGAVAFDFKSPHDPLVARKSWFFFDDEYVCLGSGIKSNPDLPVFTTINQVLMKSDVTVQFDEKTKILKVSVDGLHLMEINLEELQPTQ